MHKKVALISHFMTPYQSGPTFLLVFFLLLSMSLQAQNTDASLYSILGEEQQEIFPDSVQTYTFLSKTIETFKDENRNTTFSEVRANDSWFGPNPHTKDFDPEAVYWMKLNLQVGQGFKDTCLFYIENDVSIRTWEKIDAYLVHEDGRTEAQKAGIALPLSEKSIPSRESVVGFGLIPGEEATLYVRVEVGRPKLMPPYFLSVFARRVKQIPKYPTFGAYRFFGNYNIKNDYYPYDFRYVRPIKILEAPTPELSLETLIAQEETLNWEDNFRRVEPQRAKVYWLKTRMIGSNRFSGEHIFQVAPFADDRYAYDYVDVYTSKNGGEFSQQRTGNAIPSKERPYDFWATFFRVDLQAKDTIDLYIRLEGLDRSFPMPYLQIIHVDSSALFVSQVKEARKMMFFLGAVAMQFLFFLCLFFIERERIHLYFAVLILGNFLVVSSMDFNPHIFVPFAALSQYREFYNLIGVLLMMIGALKFVQVYFNYPPTSVYSRRIIPGMLLLDFLIFLGNIFTKPDLTVGSFGFLQILNFFIIAHLLLVIWMGIIATRQARILKLIFFIGLFPCIFLVFMHTVYLLGGYLGYNSTGASPIWIQSLPAALLFFFMVFSLSIGYRKNILKREKDKVLQENLKAQAALIEKLEENARLEEMDEVKTRFFTNITHEFRTPLTVILGMADQLKSSKGKNTLANGLDLIQRNGRKLLQLINQLLDLSKIDSAILQPNYQNKEVVSFVQYVGESFESLAEKKGVRLSIYSEIDELQMAIDPIKLQKIIANLLSNAIKFTPSRGKVVLHLSQKDQHLHLKVKDSGEGIAEAALPHIFDRFYQVDNAASRQGEGTGIGLALVKELIELHEGDIQVKSKVGSGTEFLLRLPIKEVDVPAIEVEEEELLPLDPSDTPREDPAIVIPALLEESQAVQQAQILLVEDNPDVVAYIQSVLKAHYQVQVAKDGEEGVAIAIEQVPDIIISDVMMPKKDGFQLAQDLKEDERSSHIPIILLTAKATQSDKIAGLRYGADAYLMKPFDKEELLIRLNNLLESRQAMQRKYSAPSATNGARTIQTAEDRFIEKVKQLMEEQFEDAELSVKDLAKALHLSHQQFYRKLKALTDQTPVRYLRSFRLQKARALLMHNGDLNVSEVAYEVGFDNPNYFSRVFTEEFGVSPNQLRG